MLFYIIIPFQSLFQLLPAAVVATASSTPPTNPISTKFFSSSFEATFKTYSLEIAEENDNFDERQLELFLYT
jgi:hypothetical protein